eukprot:2445313-Lingulodinium_polyedra.AAC.1
MSKPRPGSRSKCVSAGDAGQRVGGSLNSFLRPYSKTHISPGGGTQSGLSSFTPLSHHINRHQPRIASHPC